MPKLRSKAAAWTAVLAGLAIAGPALADGNACMPTLEQEIASKYSSIEHIAPRLDEIDLADPSIVLFDVREIGEHQVAHIDGSYQVAPGIDPKQFALRFSELVRGKKVIFYCSVGYRSSKLAARLAADLKANGAASVANLRGGVFALHNDKRALVDVHGPTPYVHPYDAWWSRYLDQRQLARTTPRSTPAE